MMKPSKTNAESKRSMILDGKEIVRLRKERGLTQKQFNVCERTIQNAEAGVPVGIPSAKVIADALGVTVADLRPKAQPGHQPGDNNIGRTPHPSPQDEQHLRRVIARGSRGEALVAMKEADGNQMRTQGWADGYNYPLDKLDYALLRQISDGTRTSVEDADPELTIEVFNRINRGTSAFRLQHPGNFDYKVGFLDGLLALQKGFDPQAEKVAPPKRLFGGEA